jgi:tRNA-specific 2-thiouridylase
VSKVRAISLFSGGLDSICATRLVMEQDIEVIAVKFVTPFFGYEILGDPDNYRLETKEKYGIDVRIVDISDEYLQLLRQPSHGFGKYFNPCIDCKIFMLSRARTMLKELKCSFLITGEVLGQRPMSQRRDTLNVIERDSGNRTILLRPLSAKLMNETEAEREGLIDREKLLDFSGRGRSRQIALAKSYGIVDYPAPAGGCILADPILSRRISYIYSGKFVVNQASMNVTDILLLLVGRQFILPGGGSVSDSVKQWIADGGTLIAFGRGINSIANKNSGLSSVRMRRDVLDKLALYQEDLEREQQADAIEIDFDDLWGDEKTDDKQDEDNEKKAKKSGSSGDLAKRKRIDAWQRNFSPSGVFVKAQIDPRQWLGFGLGEFMPVMVGGNNVMMSMNPTKTPIRLVDEKNLRMSGLLWPEARQRLANSSFATVERHGRGQVILFASNPTHRGWYPAMERLFLNAVLLGPGMGTSQEMPW